MQQTLFEDVVPQSFLIDSFDRFFCKTFEKDSNYGSFQKEWDNFKNILSQEALDADQIFKYIAQVQLNLSQTQGQAQAQVQGSITQPSTTNYLEQTPYKYACPSPISAGHQNSRLKGFTSNLNVMTTNDNMGSCDSPCKSSQSATKRFHQSPSPLLRIATSPTMKGDMSYFSPKVTRQNLDSYNTTPLMSKYAVAVASPSQNLATGRTTSIRFQFSSLMEKAKTLKQNVEDHTDSLAEKYKCEKNVLPLGQENRTPLKKIVIYSKEPNFKEINDKIEMKIDNKEELAKNKMFVYC